MIARVESYFQSLVSPALLKYFRERIGPDGPYLAMFDDLRSCSGDTQLHADNLGMAKRAYSDAFARLGPFCINLLIDLAEDGIKYRALMKKHD